MSPLQITELEYLRDLGELTQQLSISYGSAMRRDRRYLLGRYIIPRCTYEFYLDLAGLIEESPDYGDDSALIQYCLSLQEVMKSTELNRYRNIRLSALTDVCRTFIGKYAHGF